MGTGGFGGGSGSLGGGGAGSSGSGGSLLRAISHLRSISRMLTADGDQARLTREINALLRERGRAGFMAELFADPFASTLLDNLLTIGSRIRGGEAWSEILDGAGVTDGSESITAYCDAVIDEALRARSYTVDERYIDRAGLALRSCLASSLAGEDLLVAEQGNAAAVDAAIDRTRFPDDDTIRRSFLGQIIAKSIAGESYVDLGASVPAIERAADTLAAGIYNRFDEKFVRKGKAAPRDFLRTIGANYPRLVTGQ